ncbi:hypothetical protein EV586_102291 [Tumebacillus sp. BK434]|uniref:hypothetical protein n=1 Tax=Tumebacillus sp. BK434 TaxID=2512169 RepID=UPI0010447A9E|nr:hypothetical protein [Tumebacillus sp. BK434]TCP57845.1 hypothetical protein EV586_102291 [Tumebacillus sp. BK434]
MSRLDLAKYILEITQSIQRALAVNADEQIVDLFDKRQHAISEYLLLEEEGEHQGTDVEKIQALMREGYNLNQKITSLLKQKRQQLLQEMQTDGQMREANNAYTSPYETVYEPMFFDKKN